MVSIDQAIIYIACAVVLFGIMEGYLRIADRVGIVDIPNNRSSHHGRVIRGGGMIFFVSAICYALTCATINWLFWIGFVLVGVVSFVDDIRGVSNLVRMLVQITGLVLLIVETGLPLSYWQYPLLLVLLVAFVNAYNFMDGINGITALYTFSVLVPLLVLNRSYAFIDSELVYFLLIALLVFGFYNVRSRARCFSGDIGSISLGMLLCYLLVSATISTEDISLFVLVVVYGVDSGMTVVTRLIKGENIFRAHRSHLYQKMTNEMGLPHIHVSAWYGGVQLVISMFWLFLRGLETGFQIHFGFSILFVLIGVYFVIKRKIEFQNTTQ